MNGRDARKTEFGLRGTDGKREPAVLRDPAFGNVEAAEDLQPRDDRAVEFSREREDLAEIAVDAEADAGLRLLGFDVNVGAAFAQLHPHLALRGGILFIENVGNLVCPALWDLGERAKVVVVSVTEGDDKPLKYPDMFAAAQLLVVNKIDLLPYVSFDVEACVAYARRVQPALEHVAVSATRGDGLDALADWLQREAAALA